MSTPRLPAPFGRVIDRDSPIGFSFEGGTYTGFAGDTLASALLASDVRTLARSFKYRRPRGLLGHGDLDAHVLVQVGDEPNVPADRLLLRDGLPAIEGQNRKGSINRDRGAWSGLLARFMPVGFYYRTFFRPHGAWQWFEPMVRRRAGLGRLDRASRHAATTKKYLFFDVVVVGGGPAGIAASRAAAEAGADVLLVEATPRPGGFALAMPTGAWPDLVAMTASPKITLLTGATAQGLFADGWLAVETEQGLDKIRAKAIVVATGAAEQPLIFRNNEMPGIMLASAARRLAWLYGVRAGRRAAVATVNDHGLEAALDLIEAGVDIVVVTDLRPEAQRNELHDALSARGITVAFSAAPYEALARPGSFYFGAPLAELRLARIAPNGSAAPFDETIACDLLALAGGYTPMAGLAVHAGATLSYSAGVDALALGSVPAGVFAAGSINHVHIPADVLMDGLRAGRLAARHAGFTAADVWAAPVATPGLNHPFPIFPHPKGKEFVDFDEDLTIRDIENSVADGFAHPELLKRWSTAGMGPSQGRHSAVNVLRITARAEGLRPADLGPTGTRPPVTGERFDHLAGQAFHPWRDTPMQRRHEALGARMMVAGLWRRPAEYAAGGEAAVAEEVRAVRAGVGLIDVSTLGKVELRGPDAATFLDRIYVTAHARQPVGRSRYALLLDDAGSIIDDGVACRFGEDQFYLTATTGHSDATYRLLTWFNAQWGMDVDITNLTGAFAAVNIAGPLARHALSPLVKDVDLSGEVFPYLAARTGTVAGIPARLLRVGFVGELGYEIHVPAVQGEVLWDSLLDAGHRFGMRPFGVEAQRLLRLEKGHVIIGQDTDGLTTPFEANMAWAVPKTKAQYRGMRAVETRFARGSGRLLVGFRLKAGGTLPAENCLVIEGDAIIGRVTSAAFSESCGGVIGLVFLPPGRSAPGSDFAIRLPSGEMVVAQVSSAPFYDPGNKRQEL